MLQIDGFAAGCEAAASPRRSRSVMTLGYALVRALPQLCWSKRTQGRSHRLTSGGKADSTFPLLRAQRLATVLQRG
jgi:hypothetical protein